MHQSNDSEIYNALSSIPVKLADTLITSFKKIQENYILEKWEPAELNAGKFCEAAFSLLNGHCIGNIPTFASKPTNMVDACKNLEQYTTQPRSIRIQIPRMIIALYEIRNNRGIGHVSTDVDANRMDASAVLSISKWILAEIIRIFHCIDTTEAQSLVDSITTRIDPWVWTVNNTKRILPLQLKISDQVLLLLYGENHDVTTKKLFEWTEYSNFSVFKSKILKKLHKKRLIEYSSTSESALISPKGISYTEKNILSAL